MFFRKGRGSGPGDGTGGARQAPGTAGARPAGTGAGEAGRRLPPAPAEPSLRLDNRGLQPPEPMVRILSALDQLQPGQVLEVHNDRRPMFLLPHLDERGYQYAMADQDDGSVIIRIWKPADGAGPAAPAGEGKAGPAAGDGDPGVAGATAVETETEEPAAAAAARPPADPAAAPPGPAAVEPLVMDVRPYFARRQEPFRDIMANVARLKPGQPFVLIVGFEPVPLYWVMKRKGFEHRAERDPDGAWRVTFWRPEGGR